MTLSAAGTARAVNSRCMLLASFSRPTQRSFRISFTNSSDARCSFDLSMVPSSANFTPDGATRRCVPRREPPQDLSKIMTKRRLRGDFAERGSIVWRGRPQIGEISARTSYLDVDVAHLFIQLSGCLLRHARRKRSARTGNRLDVERVPMRWCRSQKPAK